MKSTCGDCAHFNASFWKTLARENEKARCNMHKSKRPTEKSKACKDFYNMHMKGGKK